MLCIDTARLYVSTGACTFQPAFALRDDAACLVFHMLGEESQSYLHSLCLCYNIICC